MIAIETLNSTMAGSRRPNRSLEARQVRFVTRPPAGAKIIQAFNHPRRAMAVASAIELTDPSTTELWVESKDHCWVVFLPKGTLDNSLPDLRNWIARPDGLHVCPTVMVRENGEVIRWRPGKAVVQCAPERQDEILALLADFAFYEGELRALEEGIEAHQAQAQVDVNMAYKIEQRDKQQWHRLQKCTKYFAKMRLIYARLEPQLAEPSRIFPPKSQRILSALFREADIEHRLEALDERLEALEDLYEGATDRIADYGWYREGSWMELTIIMLLIIETIVVAAEVYLHHR